MFLKSLEIRGFKSFADKTELKFKKGVTAVVGPNGSGKSNISDSVRWVLGEQSVKTLRGGKMEDVIFAGTQYRKPVGLAQVSLTLDNTDGALTSDYNEITVSRRIFRSGETEYLLNGTKCRLKDITQLFMDTGIGKEGYSLIGQGKIEAVLSGKPEERRALLEEAAGIVKYKSRKEEAEKKLSNTDENLIRIRDIISTYEERIEPLRIEREKAIEYRNLYDNLRINEVSLLVHYINSIEKTLKEYSVAILNKKNELDEKKKVLLTEKDKLKEIENRIQEIEDRTVQEKAEYYEKKESISKVSNDIDVFRERIKSLENLIEKNTLSLEEYRSKISIIKDEKDKVEKELFIKREEQREKEEEISVLENKNIESIKNINSMDEEIKRLKEDEFELLRGNSEVKNSVTLINNEIKIRIDKEETLKSSIQSIEGNIKINIATLESLINKVDTIKSDVKKLETSIYEKKKEISLLNSKISKKDTEIKLFNKNINELEANKNMLSNLDKHYEGYNRSVKILMERIDKGLISQATGTKVLGEVFNVDKEYETAIEIALGAGISNVITENENIAKELINYLKKNNIGRATFLPLDNIRGNKLSLDTRVTSMDGFIGIASDIIKFNEKYTKAINNILGRTIVCRDMDSALKLSRNSNNSYRIVTLSAELISPGGALTGGSIQGKHTNILGRKREIEEIGELLQSKKQELQVSLNEYNGFKKKLSELDESILNDRDEIHAKNVEVAKNESEIISLKNESERLKNSLEVSKLESKRNDEEILSLNNKLNEKTSELVKLEEQNTWNKERAISLEEELKVEREKLNKEREYITELKVNKASLDEALAGKLSEISRKEKEIEENILKVKFMEEENKSNKDNIQILNSNIHERFDRIEAEKNRLIELEERFKEEEVEKSKLKEDFKVKDSLINETLDIINKEEGELNKQEVQRAKSEIEKDNYYTKLNEELDLTLAEAQEVAVEVENVYDVKESIINYKRNITALGTVNLAAIQEYDEVKEKYEFMSSQEDDLQKSKEELLSVIDEMTGKMKELFKENFKVLNKNFNETFKELFKGGSAELILAEGDELTANIDINVEPPGKKFQNINLMSGGEKVLSAIALLFAILKMKPTPFCILDEIEAALDDANVYRYAEFLKEFSKGTQFIVITHRKGTMEASDVMYGVTMEEKGISKVVSVDLTK